MPRRKNVNQRELATFLLESYLLWRVPPDDEYFEKAKAAVRDYLAEDPTRLDAMGNPNDEQAVEMACEKLYEWAKPKMPYLRRESYPPYYYPPY